MSSALREAVCQQHKKNLATYSASTKGQKEAMSQTLGDIDEILPLLLNSDAPIDEDKLQKLHRIVSNPQDYNNSATTDATTRINQNDSQIEDNGNERSIELQFSNDDMLLYRLFNKERAMRIRKALTSKITIVLLAIICVFIGVSSGVLIAFDIISVSWASGLASPVFLFLIFYFVGWILTANTKAMWLIFHSFEFWLKMWSLLIFLASFTWMYCLSGVSIYVMFCLSSTLAWPHCSF